MNAETPHSPASVPVKLTARAVRKIAEILSTEAADAKLRISVTGGGCSGFQYNFVLDDKPMDDDLVIDAEGVSVLIDPVSLGFLQGAEVDFVDDLIGASFKVHNPQAKASCGCGTSFSL